MLQQVAGVPTPIGVASAYHIYNQTRSKSLVTVNNKLGQGISYDSLHRQLTSQSLNIMRQIEEDGIYIPKGITHSNSGVSHLFAIDNLDWNKKTLEGGTFNSTTAIIIEQSTTLPGTKVSVSTTCTRRRTLPHVQEAILPQCHISASDRQKSRSLSNLHSIDCLQTKDDGFAQNLLLTWRLCRTVSVSSKILDVSQVGDSFPGFPSYCAKYFPRRPASTVAYLPLIPCSPTNPAVLKEEMLRLVKLSQAIGDKWTVITGDQATYELAVAVRDKNKDLFQNVILLLGGFHLAHNFLMAICKIMSQSGAEDILVAAGLCLEGTARKMFGQKADYYQSMYAINVLSEAIWRLFWEGFEQWTISRGSTMTEWTEDIKQMVQTLINQSTPPGELIKSSHKEIGELQQQLVAFRESLHNNPTAVFWMNFLEMSDILIKFTYHEREGNWLGHLSETAKMLPYLTAAGHYKYGQQSLPLYLYEMKQLQETAPEVHQSFMQGAFVGRRCEGSHNGVSPDMLLEQTYNADAKEASGLDGIAIKPEARTKWVYTKPITAAVSSRLKTMLHLQPENDILHHEGGQTRIKKGFGCSRQSHGRN